MVTCFMMASVPFEINADETAASYNSLDAAAILRGLLFDVQREELVSHFSNTELAFFTSCSSKEPL